MTTLTEHAEQANIPVITNGALPLRMDKKRAIGELSPTPTLSASEITEQATQRTKTILNLPASNKGKRTAIEYPTTSQAVPSLASNNATGGQAISALHEMPAPRRTKKRTITTPSAQSSTPALPSVKPNADVPESSEIANAGDGHSLCDSPALHAILQLRELQSQRVTTIRAQNRIRNAAGAYVRRALGWQMDLPEKQRAKIAKQAASIIKEICGGHSSCDTLGISAPADSEQATAEDHLISDTLQKTASAVAPFVLICRDAGKPFESYRESLDAKMQSLAESLPVWSKVSNIRGFSSNFLAQIIGEAGDLSQYSTPSKLWKRFGLAPSGCYAMETKEGKTANAIPRRRRSVLWVVGDVLIKTNATGKGEDRKPGEYRQLYLNRKAYELSRADEGRTLTPMHAHRRAQRYMEKRLVLNLWKLWTNQ